MLGYLADSASSRSATYSAAPAAAGIFILSNISECPPDTRFIESAEECTWAATSLLASLELTGNAIAAPLLPASSTGETFGCAYSKFLAEQAGTGVRFNSVGLKTGNGADRSNFYAVVSICRSGEGGCTSCGLTAPLLRGYSKDVL